MFYTDTKEPQQKVTSAIATEPIEYTDDKRPEICRAYENSMTQLLKMEPHKARRFLDESLMPVHTDYGKVCLFWMFSG
jgi:hypothetical protein